MKKRLIGSLLGLSILVFSSMPKQAAPVHAETKTIKMGYFEYGSMCRGAEDGAEKSGYVYEFMQKLATYTGWKYEYTYGSYDELYYALKEGTIDILPYTNWNETRATEVLFSKNALLEEEYFLATRPDDKTIIADDTTCFNGKIFASVKGADQNSLLDKYLVDNSIDATVKYFDNPELSWNALENKEVDVAVFSSISFRPNANWNIYDSFGSKPTYIALSKTSNDLLKELDDAFDMLLQTNQSFISQIQEALYDGSPAYLCLSEKEKLWLENHKTIRLGYLEGTNLRYVYKKDDGSYGGFIPELLTKMFDMLKIDNKVQYFGYQSPAEAGDDLLSDRLETVYPFFPAFRFSEQREVIVSNSFNENTVAVAYKNDVGYANAMKKVAVLSSSIIQYYLEYNEPNTEVVVVNTVDEAIKLLKKGEVTGFVSDSSETTNVVQTYRDYSQYILNKMCGTAFAANLDDSSLIVMLNRGISNISESEISAMVANNTIKYEISLSKYIESHPEALALVIIAPLFIVGLFIVLIVVSRLRRKAQTASEAKTKFLFNMSHDIRTPMNAIIGFTDSAIRHKDNETKVEENLQKIKLSSNHLLKLINDILEMSRIESGNLELAENPVDIRIEAEKVDNMIQSLAVGKSIQFKTTVHNFTHPYIYADELHVNQILINLISNAIKYTNEGGKVGYDVYQISNVIDGKVTYRFEITDNGIGMSDEFQKHLFESFSREKTSTVSKQEGTGLGLSIVKKIVDLAGGRIYFKSTLNVGSQFTVELPFKVLDENAIEEFKKQVETKTMSVSNEKLLLNKRILVVEDNEMNRDIAQDILGDYGCIVETAEDGLAAVNVLKEKGEDYYDFVLMDIQMPVMNGYEATKQIREMYPDNKLIIIALSANAFNEDKQESIRNGMNDHVAKPIDINELLNVLRKFLK